MIEKMVNSIYQVVTVVLIISAWVLCLFPPIVGGMVGFVILLILTIKLFIGKFVSQVKGGTGLPGQTPPEEAEEENNEEETEESGSSINPQQMQNIFKGAKAEGAGGMGGAGGMATKANIWALIIDYITTPMTELEKGALMFGWIVFPFLFFLVPVMILLMMKDTCSYFSEEICNIIWK